MLDMPLELAAHGRDDWLQWWSRGKAIADLQAMETLRARAKHQSLPPITLWHGPGGAASVGRKDSTSANGHGR